MALKVNIDDLVASGVAVTGHGEDVAMKHCTADTLIETAHDQRQGRSAASLTQRMPTWSTTTTTLLAQLSDHAQGLRTCAQHFCAMEQHHAQALEESVRQADSIATRV